MQIEPHADIRVSAATSYQIFVAYLEVGFTPEQAMDLLKAVLTAQLRKDEQ